ncbi:MAG: putative glutathione S-transferase-related transrane protein [Patescibacteria group bacterium]|jgi:uncharacterized protein YndB with AHSA1/START domain|nr:putative glutathione S-transferase-related transrane protein [Patescibacteria group bacterium]
MGKVTIIAEPGSHSITIIREFDAPRELVFKAYTDPELFAQWQGPRRLTTTIEKFEPVAGGSWSYVAKDTDGSEYRFHGVNHEVTAPERIIGTFEFEGLPEKGHVALDTAYFEELPGDRTRVKGVSVFQSVEDRDGMMESGMELGVKEGFEQLEEILEKMK